MLSTRCTRSHSFGTAFLTSHLASGAKSARLFALFPLLLLAQLAFAGEIIQDVNTDLSHYTPGSTVTIYVDLNNTSGSSQNGSIGISITHLGVLTTTLLSQNFSLANGGTTTLAYTWIAPSTDFTGYSLEVSATNSGGTTLDSINGAVDVSSTWTKFPRYGYVADYPSSMNSSTATHGMWLLKNYHIDGVQFYDWQWKHHLPLAGSVSSPASSWENIDGSTQLRLCYQRLYRWCPLLWYVRDDYNLMYGAFAGSRSVMAAA